MATPRGNLTILVVLALAATLSPVSIDMLTPALPGIASDMGSSPQMIELAIYSFLVGYGIAPSLWGAWSDRVGRRPIMVIGMLIYCASSLACSVVDSPAWLIALRLGQGIGAAAGATMARAIIRDIYGGGGTTRGMARMFSIMSVIPFFMPLLGGYMAR
ncbi:MAG: DHA1 family bicyclomycin/chloramphenicol resistance-like MFS transporter, partial [Halieaceae bacterium]